MSLKRLYFAFVLAVGLVIGWALVTTAQANVKIEPPCTSVKLTNFEPRRYITGDLTVNGVTDHVQFIGPEAEFPVPAGATTVTASFTVAGETWYSNECVVQPQPVVQPPPTQQPPDQAQPEDGVKKRTITCTWLKKVGAGRKHLIKYGCITPRRPRPPVTPADRCPPEKAGERWHRRARERYGCPLPPRFRPPRVQVPVTG